MTKPPNPRETRAGGFSRLRIDPGAGCGASNGKQEMQGFEPERPSAPPHDSSYSTVPWLFRNLPDNFLFLRCHGVFTFASFTDDGTRFDTQ
jgi:hypothetical protein